MAAPIEIIDDEFDWDAAVQEIDVACQNSRLSTSTSVLPPLPAEKWEGTSSSYPCPQVSGLPFKKHRQLTIDRFVGDVSKPNSSSRLVRESEKENLVVGKFDGGKGARYVDIDPEAAKTWIYPENVPVREYQLSITKTALFSNTLVALPTGLGKTLIAAVVMYNYFRWFPEGKIVFAAPSRPLVMQQIEACHNIVGIPQEWTIDMTGQTTPAKRACLWKDKRVFFVTPQVLEKDIQSGTCLLRYLVCLVIDEAHRAVGNYSYCVIVRELTAVPVHLRILALTATPGSKQESIQQVIDNLQISTLEYKNESDPDVIPYVHDRKIELIEVPMGQNAVDINNLILDVVRPLAARLCKMGVLPGRDFQTLSPCDLLNSRDRFRQAPPPDLPHFKYGEVEGLFSVLITLYHIRKLLSSHGIRPAFEMLEEKLTQGSFARMMSRNEVIQRVKLLMQRSLLHGASSPKLSKMIEVLVDHFRHNDPANSRVIIFSNFRGSVRDIMDALMNVGNSVKPTEFVGQSSGKVSKGQTQKIQQAVLEKFRKGGYNAIVATSIGEEGLDIAEVDLVICFDANISPLRMIQRMGRTGRKHNGRVVVLACEGAELKGYKRKQATGRLVRKHMSNGGLSSFNFHPSPRMVPHVFKPEQCFLRLSIAEFIPRGKKLNGDSAPAQDTIEKLTNEETLTLAKYFRHKEVAWKPSLIAFPHFQAFPTGVDKVQHSSRTGMLIDMMQRLEGISSSSLNSFNFLSKEHSNGRLEAIESSLHVEEDERLLNGLNMGTPNSPDEEMNIVVPTSDAPLFSWEKDNQAAPHNKTHDTVIACLISPLGKKNQGVLDLPLPALLSHEYLFSSEVASVDPHGRVFITPVPILAFRDILYSKSQKESGTFVLNCSIGNAQASPGDIKESSVDTTAFANMTTSDLSKSKNMKQSSEVNDEERVIQTPPCKEKCGDESMGFETPDAFCSPWMVPESNDDVEVDLSPRLTNFIRSGFVPESPVCSKIGEPDVEAAEDEEITAANSSGSRNKGLCPIDIPVQLPTLEKAGNSYTEEKYPENHVIEHVQSPTENLTNSDCSKEWYMRSGKKTEQNRQLKRLRRIGETRPCKNIKEKHGGCSKNLARTFADATPNSINPGCKEITIDVRDFIDEEAEVSLEADASEDEVGENEDSYDNSFIDDRLDPTAASTQAEGSSGVDMMAVYRRSLLSQSPLITRTKFSTLLSTDPMGSASRTTESENPESSKGNERGLHTPEAASAHPNFSNGKNSVCSRRNLGKMTAEDSVPTTSGRCDHINDPAPLHSRKRKLSSSGFYVPAINLEKEFSGSCANDINNNISALDDQFFEGLDFDELEGQAAELLRLKVDSSIHKESASKSKQSFGSNVGSAPSFDLGIE